ncbi:alkene reductase [Frigidibacter oleivorans]|uniref:alkene reductase n=1 Tax=Frigidibacter oleivorans TaxID=2487129 RepID=UPI000F8DE1B2|nr:alkene reductase [Frigidibacter oleivorans]
MTDALFTPTTLGQIPLKNRVVMAPLTRNRARPEDDTPHDLHATYYAQRAGAGLIVSEGTQISPEGKGYAWTPGIHSPEQVAGWKRVTEAVHAKGGRIVAQLWHVGRISHVSLQPGGAAPVAPSALGAGSKTFDGTGFVETSVPRELTEAEIARIVADYAHAARCAEEAGFDGVEIHGANGYLIDQFLRDSSNHRTDGYGGSIENRVRFLREVVAAVTGVLGGGRTGIRISPWSNANNVGIDSDTPALFGRVVEVLNGFGLAFLHVVEGQTGGDRNAPAEELAKLRAAFDGPWIANNGYNRAMAIAAVAEGRADAVAFGRPFIANPDLVERLERDAPLAEGDRDTYYGGGAAGYTDYPTLQGAAEGAA